VWKFVEEERGGEECLCVSERSTPELLPSQTWESEEEREESRSA